MTVQSPDKDEGPTAGEHRRGNQTTIVASQTTSIHVIDDPPPLTATRYKFSDEIEQGGMGIVYLARDLKLSRDVAIKVLRQDRAESHEAVRSYCNEARIMSYLSHPGVTPIYDTGICEDGRPFHVMKLIEGNTLTHILHSEKPGISQPIGIFADICHTMAYAHSHKVMHLDLKPSNIMVGPFGEVVVMDWGLAQFDGAPPDDKGDWSFLDREHAPEWITGTPEYMSPEQARGEELDRRADVFGLGAILCEILTGQAPYQGKSLTQIYKRAVKGSIHSTLSGLEDCDSNRALVRLAKHCLAPDRNDRPASAVEVAKEVADYQDTALRQVESDMNRFFELSLDLFCIADFDGRFRRINSNFSRVLGYTEEELLARPFLDFVHADDLDETIRRMAVLTEGKSVVGFRNRYRTSTGSYVTFEWTAKSIEDEHMIFAVARDVTAD